MNKIIALTKYQERARTIVSIIRATDLKKYVNVIKTHTSTTPTQSINENVGRFLAAMRAIEENADGWIQKIQQMMHDEKNLDEINSELQKKIGYTVSKDVKIQLPLFISHILAFLPTLVLQKYNEASEKEDLNRFIRQFLGAGEVCIQGMYEKVVSYEPLSFTEIEPIPDYCKTNELKMGFLRSQRDVKCVNAYRKYYAGPELENTAESTILQLQAFIDSVYGPNSIRYQRGLVQLFRNYGLSRDDIKGFMKDQFSLNDEHLLKIMAPNMDDLKTAMQTRSLGIRLESSIRGDGDWEGFSGMGRTFSKLQSETPFPVVNVGSDYFVNVYVRRIMNAGLGFLYDESSFHMASKQDFGSDRILDILPHKDYQRCKNTEEQARYLENAFKLKKYLLITDHTEWKDKLDELSEKNQYPDTYRSSKYALKKLNVELRRLAAMDVADIDRLIRENNKGDQYQLRNALRKLKKLDHVERKKYIDKAQEKTEIAQSKRPKSAEVIPAVHNEVLIKYPTTEGICAIYVDLSLPGTFSQAKSLQDILQETNGGERLPIFVYSETEATAEEVSPEALGAIDAFLENLKSMPQNLDAYLTDLISKNENLKQLEAFIKSSAVKFLIKYYIVNLKFDELDHFLKKNNFDSNRRMQIEFADILEGIYRTSIWDILEEYAAPLVKYVQIILKGSSLSSKAKVVRLVAMMSGNLKMCCEISKNKDFINLLLDAVQSGSDDMKKDASFTLLNITICIDDPKVLIENRSLIPILCRQLESGSDDVKRDVSRALARITKYPDVAKALTEHRSLIPILCRQLESGSDDVKKEVYCALANIAQYPDLAKVLSKNRSLIPILCRQLESGADDVKKEVYCVLANIAQYLDVAKALSKNRSVIPMLCQQLESGPDNIKRYVYCALANIAQCPDAAKVLSENTSVMSILCQCQLPQKLNNRKVEKPA